MSSSASVLACFNIFRPHITCSCNQNHWIANEIFLGRVPLQDYSWLSWCTANIVQHDFVEIFFRCTLCGIGFFETFEFGQEGQHRRKGRYSKSRTSVKHRKLARSLSYGDLQEILDKTDQAYSAYSVFRYNCYYYASELFNNIINYV